MLCPQLLLSPGDLVPVPAPHSQWAPGLGAAHPFVLLGQTHCSTWRALAFAGRAEHEESLVGGSSSNRWQEERGEDDRNSIFTIYFEYVLRLAMMNFNECIPPSSLGSNWQAGSGFVLQVHRKHTPLATVGMKTGEDYAFPSNLYLRQVGISLSMSGSPGCSHRPPFQLLQAHSLSAL